jgi:hypothetical protein
MTKLFLNLNLRKAAGTPSAGILPKEDGQAQQAYKESFKERNSGVANEAGGLYENTNKAKQAKEAKEEEEAEEEPELQKAMDFSSFDLLKSFNATVAAVVNKNRLTGQEIRFFKSKGYSDQDISSMRINVTQRDKKEFNKFLSNEFYKSLGDLNG